MSNFLRSLPQAGAILEDVSHQRGFLHRLDVPSSGLILVTKTYEAYYDLRLQMSLHEIQREYLILCHGFSTSRHVNCRVWWLPGDLGPSRVASAGRVAITHLAPQSFHEMKRKAFTLALAKIVTGRRHQIRLHCAHLGHALVSDAKYSALSCYEDDLRWCPRNFLHRFRLRFMDSALGGVQDLSEPLPADLLKALDSTDKVSRLRKRI